MRSPETHSVEERAIVLEVAFGEERLDARDLRGRNRGSQLGALASQGTHEAFGALGDEACERGGHVRELGSQGRDVGPECRVFCGRW